MVLIIAWDLQQRGPMAIRLAANLRQARAIVSELEKEYPTAPRISLLKEVDYIVSIDAIDMPFLPKDGWDEPRTME